MEEPFTVRESELQHGRVVDWQHHVELAPSLESTGIDVQRDRAALDERKPGEFRRLETDRSPPFAVMKLDVNLRLIDAGQMRVDIALCRQSAGVGADFGLP